MNNYIHDKFYCDMHLAAVIGEAISHKLNNSLSGIHGYVDFTLEKLKKGNIEEKDIENFKRFLEMSVKESQYSSGLMRNFRWFSKAFFKDDPSGRPKTSKPAEDLMSFWEELSAKSLFENLTISWKESSEFQIYVDVSPDSLFSWFYTFMLSVVRLYGEEEKAEMNVSFLKDEEKFLRSVYSVIFPKEIIKEDIEMNFILFDALIKSLYCRFDFSVNGREVKFFIDFPLKVERI